MRTETYYETHPLVVEAARSFNYVDWHWYSDYNGDEAGFPEVCVVGLYGRTIDVEGQRVDIEALVDTENEHVLMYEVYIEE